MSKERNFSTRVLISLGKLTLCAALFPYQVTLNRKEGSFGVRSILVGMRVKRKKNETGKRSTEISFTAPGFAFGEAKKSMEKRFPKKKKKKLVLRRKRVKRTTSEKTVI